MRATLLALALSISLLPRVALAQWQPDGVAVCAATGNQDTPMVASDGVGGAIVAWQDLRVGTDYDIYVRRVNASGVPQWTVDGVALCNAANDQVEPTIASDGAGGAIVAWKDSRNGMDGDIYVQRVNAIGVPQWTADGVALCTAGLDQYTPTIVSDGVGGAIITWYDARNVDTDIYAQRVNASGVPQWTADGVAVCSAVFSQYWPTIASDGAAGAIVTWVDDRSGMQYDIYAQRVDSSGVPQWTADGVALCTAANQQSSASIISDGVGGAIVSWDDQRSAIVNVYVQRVNASGVPQWTANGVALCSATSSSPAIVTDGAAGAIVSWHDGRNGAVANIDIFGQRVNASGVPQWTINGVAISTAANHQTQPEMSSDGAGGAIVTWNDRRTGSFDVYAQRVDASGVPQWNFSGVALSAVVYNQFNPSIVADGAGGAIVAWHDGRSGTSSDIYAQHVGTLGPPTSVPTTTPGPSLIVSGVYPNPFTSTTWFDVELAAPSSVRVDVFDVAGRAVRATGHHNVSGSRRFEFDGRDDAGRLLPSGVYFCRLQANGETITRKMVIAR